MRAFDYRDGSLCAEGIAVGEIARTYGTPCYIYSCAALREAVWQFQSALGERESLICYAVKANSNLSLLNLIADLGSGFDIVSGGELARVIAAGGDPARVVFSGVGKGEGEMRDALAAGILCFNVESRAELDRLDAVAASMGRCAPIALRVNPDVDPKTHPYISTGLRNNKFGVPYDEALPLYRRALAKRNLRICGVACHIGSQLLDPSPAAEAAEKIFDLVEALRREGITLDHVDLGGGFGIRYRDESPPSLAEYLSPLLNLFAKRPERLLFEPGRALVGNAGILLTRVEYLKHGAEKNFAVVDAAMNDLMRPALYDAWHDIVPVVQRPDPPQTYEVVGPVCESGDFLGHGRSLVLAEGDLLAVMSAGAYGMAMSSNYNTRPRPEEILVDGDRAVSIRPRERVEDLFASEQPIRR